MKVLHLIKSLGRGGAEMLLQETLKHHDKNNFEFHYIYFLPWKNQMEQGIKDAGGNIINIPAVNNKQIILKTNKVIQYIKQHQIELVHCHLPWAGFVGRLIHKRTGIPVVYTEHNKQERYHFITKYINKYTFNWQTKAIAVSSDVAESIQKNIHPKIPVQTILNGVDTDHFVRNESEGDSLREKYSIPKDAIVIGTIAVFRFQKRLKEWIDVFAKIKSKHTNTYAFIIGDGPLKQEIVEHIKTLGLENNIIMPGLQTNVLPWLSAIDIFMMSSVFEGLPIALLEAMSMECAIVTTNAGGIRELIRDKEDGFLVSVEDWQQLEEPVSFLIDNLTQIKSWGLKARQRVQESFSMKKMVKETEDLYKEILTQGR